MTSSATFFYKEEVFPNIQLDHFLIKPNLITVSLPTKSSENDLSSHFFCSRFPYAQMVLHCPKYFLFCHIQIQFFQYFPKATFSGGSPGLSCAFLKVRQPQQCSLAREV